MQIDGTLSPRFLEGAAPPICQKSMKAIAWIAMTALAYFIAGWVGLVASTLAFGATQLSSKPPPFVQPCLVRKIHPQDFYAPFRNLNKAYAHHLLTENRPLLEDQITLEKRQISQLPDTLLNQQQKPKVTLKEGPFAYLAGQHHWTANFGDRKVFFGSITGLLAQDELQALEHPAISHVFVAIENDPIFGKLDLNGSALLVEGAKRYGKLNDLEHLYGNQFAEAPLPDVGRAIERFPDPQESKLFVFVAPHIAPQREGMPYQYTDLRALFSNAFAAFSSIAAKDANAVIHTGNWGCGAFGNDPKTVALIQLAAARFAGIRDMHYYPLGSAPALRAAEDLLQKIEREHPRFTAEEFLRHLTAFAAEYGLVYRRGNGT